ncbi:MAG TPA: hypothetical protein DER68_00940 [Ruminococcaceae bacterium]|nr:hypothetical protein [Oscillospiraceae bacterium]
MIKASAGNCAVLPLYYILFLLFFQDVFENFGDLVNLTKYLHFSKAFSCTKDKRPLLIVNAKPAVLLIISRINRLFARIIELSQK